MTKRFVMSVLAFCGHDIELSLPKTLSVEDAEREVEMAQSLSCANCAAELDRKKDEERKF